jgi:hypothetical protein
LNIVGLVIGCVFGGLIAFCLIGWTSLRIYHRLQTYKTDLSIKEKLLETTSVELAALERVLSIQPGELTLLRMVDAGSFGEVWQGEYQVRTVWTSAC